MSRCVPAVALTVHTLRRRAQSRHLWQEHTGTDHIPEHRPMHPIREAAVADGRGLRRMPEPGNHKEHHR
jgi:hypothetical protein